MMPVDLITRLRGRLKAYEAETPSDRIIYARDYAPALAECLKLALAELAQERQARQAAEAERGKYLALWNEQGLVSRRYHEQAQDAATENLRLLAIIQAYRAQHDCCTADDDEEPGCPCETCDAARQTLAEEQDG